MAAPPVTDNWYATRVSNSTMSAHTRVNINSSGLLVVAAAADRAVGYLTERGAVAGQPATYKRAGAPEHVGIALTATAVGALLYAAAAGKVDDVDAGGAVVVGRATSATTAADQLLSFEKVE